MTMPEIIASVDEAFNKHGFRALVLQCGQDAYTVEELVSIVRTIKESYPVLIFISFGELDNEALKKLYAVGARGILLRFETSNEKLFKTVHPDGSLAKRIAILEEAFRLGYLILTGGLIGLPGQTDTDILADIQLAKKLKTEMYSFGPFLPHPQTPLAQHGLPAEAKVMNTLAVARLLDPVNSKILVTTALETLDPDSAKKALLAGANTVMLNVTPIKYRKLYDLYPHRAHTDDLISDQIKNTLALLKGIGRAPTDLGI